MTGVYKSYQFSDKDPIIDYIRTVVEDSGETYKYVETHSGVTTHTLRSWFHGKTRKPQSATINAVLRCLGYKLDIVPVSQQSVIKPTTVATTSLNFNTVIGIRKYRNLKRK